MSDLSGGVHELCGVSGAGVSSWWRDVISGSKTIDEERLSSGVVSGSKTIDEVRVMKV